MEEKKKEFGIQWHITTECGTRCRHCYMFQSESFQEEKENELSLADIKKIIDSLLDFCENTNTRPHISFTGGDPLLRPDFFQILEYIEKKRREGIDFSLRILGNPFLLTRLIIRDLERFGIEKYQISLDGLQEMHDSLRKKGSFNESLRAFNLLRESKITSLCMFSLSKLNADDLKGVMALAVDQKINVFSFARVVPFGQMKREEFFSSLEYRDFLADIYTYQLKLIKDGATTKFAFKDHLWKLFFYERGKYQTVKDVDQVSDGCGMGINSLSVLADGTVYACRRFVSPVGKLPQQSISQVFLGKKLNRYRQIERFEKCSKCELLNYCRGCPAVAWEVSGSYLNADPQCWKSL